MVISNEIYEFFSKYIYSHTGILYAERDYYRLDSRLKTLVDVLSVPSVEDVYRKYKAGVTQDLHTLLINLATNNETYFMRDTKPFKALTNTVLPDLFEKKPGTPIKLWSAGCSTGQEIWSILMSVDSNSNPGAISKLSIDATDISTDALKKAKSGNYDGLEVQRGLPINLLMKYFSQGNDETWTIDSSLKSKVSFREFNLLTETFPKEAYDIIFCRNVLIYQDQDNRKKILNNLHSSLKVGGYFFMGSGESLIGTKLKMDHVSSEGTIIYKKVET